MEKRQKTKRIFKKALDIFTDILLIASITILILSAYTAYQYKENPEEAYLMDYKPILVLTGSMEPTMEVNAICIAKKIDYNDVAVGDIIMYEIEDKLITHRVIEITEEGIRTKGDNNSVEDAYYLTQDNVKAKVIHIANWTAAAIREIQTTQGKIKWIGFPLFVLAVLLGLKCAIKKILSMEDKPETEETREASAEDTAALPLETEGSVEDAGESETQLEIEETAEEVSQED